MISSQEELHDESAWNTFLLLGQPILDAMNNHTAHLSERQFNLFVCWDHGCFPQSEISEILSFAAGSFRTLFEAYLIIIKNYDPKYIIPFHHAPKLEMMCQDSKRVRGEIEASYQFLYLCLCCLGLGVLVFSAGSFVTVMQIRLIQSGMMFDLRVKYM